MGTILVWLAVCFVWSTVWLFIKLGLRDVPPLSFAAVRLMIASAVLLTTLAVRRTPLPRRPRDLAFIAATSFLLLSLNYGLLYWGARHIPSGLTAVLQASTPAFGLVFARRFLPGERLTRAKVGAVALGLAGVAVIFSNELRVSGQAALFGSAAVAGGAACVALAYVLVKAYGAHLRPSVLTAGQTLCGMLPLLAAGLVKEGNPFAVGWTRTAVGCLLYLALAGSVGAFYLNYWLLKRMDATKVLSMALVEPLIAVLLGAALLGERLTGRTLAGGALVIVSVALTLPRRRVEVAPAAET